MRFTSVLFVLLACSCVLQGQQSPQTLEERIKALEARASKADMLEVTVKELQERLSTYESEELESQLERAIASLTANVGATVEARHDAPITVGGQLRLRAEYRTVSRYNAASPRDTDEDFVIQRSRVNFDARIMDDLRVFLELQDSRTWGSEMGVIVDQMGVDLHQGYVDFENLFGSEFTLRAGRFELTLWNQRLISPLDWHPVGRAWDGLIVMGALGEVDVAAGYHTIAEDVAIDSDKDTDLYWTALTAHPDEGHEVGAAFFWLHSNTGSTDLSFGTVTLHAQGKLDSFDYSLDGVYQFGDVETLDVEAYAAAVELGYTFAGASKARIAVEWTYASGDDDPNDGDFGTFNPLFPFGHAYQGYLDLFAWINGHDVSVKVGFAPAESWWMEVDVHGFWLDETEDAWYGANGRPIRFNPMADSSDVGYEIDLSVKHFLSDRVWIWFGYSHFFAGDYVDETGDDPDTDWFWFQFTATF